MKTYHVRILKPEAIKLLQDLADLELISFKPSDDSLQSVISRIRSKAKSAPPSLDEITKEVERVRAKRYASKKK